jgi:hypothetical protein
MLYVLIRRTAIVLYKNRDSGSAVCCLKNKSAIHRNMYNPLIPAFVKTRSFCNTVTSITLIDEESTANHKHNKPRVFTMNDWCNKNKRTLNPTT